jgi:hypothetical protein
VQEPATTTGTSLEAPLLDPVADPADKEPNAEGEEDEEEDKRGLLISFLALCLSIPALIGA